MLPINVPTRPRASSQTWPRVAALALVGIAVASCSDSGRFGYTNTASRPAPQQDVTGSIAPRSVPTSRVVSQPLPAPSRPATVAANGGYAAGAAEADRRLDLGRRLAGYRRPLRNRRAHRQEIRRAGIGYFADQRHQQC